MRREVSFTGTKLEGQRQAFPVHTWEARSKLCLVQT